MRGWFNYAGSGYRQAVAEILKKGPLGPFFNYLAFNVFSGNPFLPYSPVKR